MGLLRDHKQPGYGGVHIYRRLDSKQQWRSGFLPTNRKN